MNWRFGGSDVRRLLAVLVLLPGEAAAQEMHETLEAGAHATHDPALALLRIHDDAERGELVLDLGPIALPAGATHHEVRQPQAQRVTLPVGGGLHGFRVEVLDREGRAIERRVLHHVNVIAPGRRELFSQIMQRVAAAGHETPSVELPRLVGYPIEEGDTLLVTAMFHNPTDRAYRHAYLRVRMPYTPADAWLPPISRSSDRWTLRRNDSSHSDCERYGSLRAAPPGGDRAASGAPVMVKWQGRGSRSCVPPESRACRGRPRE